MTTSSINYNIWKNYLGTDFFDFNDVIWFLCLLVNTVTRRLRMLCLGGKSYLGTDLLYEVIKLAGTAIWVSFQLRLIE